MGGEVEAGVDGGSKEPGMEAGAEEKAAERPTAVEAGSEDGA
mgnify:CR=1 FL=1